MQVGEWGYTSADSESVCCGGAKLTELQHAHLVARLYLVSIAAGSEYCLMYEWADGVVTTAWSQRDNSLTNVVTVLERSAEREDGSEERVCWWQDRRG